jgi:hypothetical protein
MKTDALIAMLARGPVRAARGVVAGRLLAAGCAGLALALVALLAQLGVRPDLDSAVALPMFWCKLAIPLAVAAMAFAAATRLARPGERAGAAAASGAALLAVLWAAAALDIAAAPAGSRFALVAGDTALPCVVAIVALSLPLLAAVFVALRGLAPTRPIAAGAAAGALAGGVSAMVYAIHCTEMALPFVAVWYVLGMALPAALGALLGRRWLRWA